MTDRSLVHVVTGGLDIDRIVRVLLDDFKDKYPFKIHSFESTNAARPWARRLQLDHRDTHDRVALVVNSNSTDDEKTSELQNMLAWYLGFSNPSLSEDGTWVSVFAPSIERIFCSLPMIGLEKLLATEVDANLYRAATFAPRQILSIVLACQEHTLVDTLLGRMNSHPEVLSILRNEPEVRGLRDFVVNRYGNHD